DGQLNLAGVERVPFSMEQDLVLHRRESLPVHPNGMRFTAENGAGAELASGDYYSVGGGFVMDEQATGSDRVVPDRTTVPFPFRTGEELMHTAIEGGLPISEVMRVNELSWRDATTLHEQALRI